MKTRKTDRLFSFQTLAARITVLVLATLVVFTLALGMIAFQITSNWLEGTAVANLEALASARQFAVEALVEGHLEKLEAFEQPDLEIKAAAMLAASDAERAALHDELVAGLRRRQIADPHLEWAEIMDLTGTVVAATRTEREGVQYRDSEVFSEGQIRSFTTDPFVEEGKIHIELSLPLHDANNITVGVLLLRFDAGQLLAITGDYTGLGETGETVLGTRREDEIHFLAPLRFDPNLSEIEPAPTAGERAKPMIHATAGQSGVTHASDYRDVRVIAAYRPIPSTGWGLVVKQDEAEAFASVVQMRTTLLLGFGALLLLGAVIVLPLVRTATQPVRELERATRQVAAGDLTINVPISLQDEVGQLGKSFNVMVDRLRETRDELERSNEELDSFAYVVSHDLKAPLRAISQLANWIAEDYEELFDKDGREKLELIIGRAKRMHNLIEGILQYSRIGRVRESERRVELDKLVQETIEMLAPPENITVTVDDDLPAVVGEPTRLGQVFQNLVSNSIKFMDKSEGWIKIGCQDNGAYWLFSVADNGPGIEEKYYDKVFQMFQTLVPRDEFESTGIGLTLVKKIVETRGGDVWVESILREGSTFYFTWPKESEGE